MPRQRNWQRLLDAEFPEELPEDVMFLTLEEAGLEEPPAIDTVPGAQHTYYDDEA